MENSIAVKNLYLNDIYSNFWLWLIIFTIWRLFWGDFVKYCKHSAAHIFFNDLLEYKWLILLVNLCIGLAKVTVFRLNSGENKAGYFSYYFQFLLSFTKVSSELLWSPVIHPSLRLSVCLHVRRSLNFPSETLYTGQYVNMS